MKKAIWVLPLFIFISVSSLVSAEDLSERELAGKKIYLQLCVYCHKQNYDDKFGPGLAGILERRSTSWLHRFLENPAKMIREDEYASSLKENNEYSLVMPKLPEMQDEKKREDVIAYMRTLK